MEGAPRQNNENFKRIKKKKRIYKILIILARGYVRTNTTSIPRYDITLYDKDEQTWRLNSIRIL